MVFQSHECDIQMVPKISFLLVMLVTRAPYKYNLMAKPSSGPEGGRETERERGREGRRGTLFFFFCLIRSFMRQKTLHL